MRPATNGSEGRGRPEAPRRRLIPVRKRTVRQSGARNAAGGRTNRPNDSNFRSNRLPRMDILDETRLPQDEKTEAISEAFYRLSARRRQDRSILRRRWSASRRSARKIRAEESLDSQAGRRPVSRRKKVRRWRRDCAGTGAMTASPPGRKQRRGIRGTVAGTRMNANGMAAWNPAAARIVARENPVAGRLRD